MHNSYLIKKKYIQPYKQQAMHFNTTPLTQNQLLKQVTTIIWKSSTESRAKFSFLKSISFFALLHKSQSHFSLFLNLTSF